MSLVQCQHINKQFGEKVALNDINLELSEGKIIGLLGPNGSGKTTLIKILCGLLTPTNGEVKIKDFEIGVETKKIVSYLPERTYINPSMTVKDMLIYFKDFYADFDINRAKDMLNRLSINEKDCIKTMSKGTREKVQLILVMSRNADLYLLDEPIGGVDPAARDYILNTIISNYNEKASVIISTHLISDIENILDEVIFIKNGNMILHSTVDDIREQHGKSVDGYFREVFAC